MAHFAIRPVMANTLSATFVYKFDPLTSGGVDGAITTFVGANSTFITAELDVTKADWTALTAADTNCANVTVTDFAWHIHTKWNNPGKVSELTKECSFEKTANHYDPDFACGLNSDNIKEPQCANKVYACDPDSYANDANVCEKGDLSGKLGKMKSTNGKIVATWTDTGNYPTVAEHKDSWNIVLHAVCGTATPRFVCANGKAANSTTNSTTASPTITAPSLTPTTVATSNVPAPTSGVATTAPSTTDRSLGISLKVSLLTGMALIASIATAF